MLSIARRYPIARTSLNVYAPDISNVYDNQQPSPLPAWSLRASFDGRKKRRQKLEAMVREAAPAAGAHLIGYSLGGTISRIFTAMAPTGTVRSLITIGSPYSFSQISPQEPAFTLRKQV
jgi:hypothetical protein